MKLLLVLLLSSLLFANPEQNTTIQTTTQPVPEKQNITIEEQSDKIKELNSKLNDIDKELNSNVWYAKYTNYKIYNGFKLELKNIKTSIKKTKSKESLQKLAEKEKNIKNKMKLLEEFKDSPFSDLLNPKVSKPMPQVKSPFDMISAFSYLKILKSTQDLYNKKLKSISELILLFKIVFFCFLNLQNQVFF